MPPTTNSFELSVIASADLKGMGARQGVALSHVWHPPPPPPPWIVGMVRQSARAVWPAVFLLLLFLFRPNRSSPAWLIWLPLLFTLGAAIGIVAPFLGADTDLIEALCCFVVGLTATWLLTPYLNSPHRLLVFFKTLPVLAGFSLLAFVPRLLGENEGFFDARMYVVIGLGAASLVATLALVLGGFAVRRRFGAIRLLLWVSVWILLAWSLVTAPFLIPSALSSSLDWADYFRGLLVTCGLTLGLLLPLLLLSFLQPFYRERFLAFLHVS